MGSLENLETCSCGFKFEIGEKYCFNCGKPKFSLSSLPEEKNSSRMNNLTCPSCGKEMKKGFIQSENPLRWRDLDSKWYNFGDMIEDNKSNEFSLIHGIKTHAFKCEGCKIIQLYYKD